MINRKAAIAVAESLQASKYIYQKILIDFKDAVYQAKTVKEIIYAKKILLRKIVKNLPVGEDSCYFCIATNGNCDKCDYRKRFGRCTLGNRYGDIKIAQTKLYNQIDRYSSFLTDSYEESFSKIDALVSMDEIDRHFCKIVEAFNVTIFDYSHFKNYPWTSPNLLMFSKKTLLLRIVHYLPLSPMACYFCLIHDNDCEKCSYGKIHGRCRTIEPRSTYKRIIDAQDVLEIRLDKYWE